MTVLTNRIVAVDIPVAVDEIIHIAAVPLAIYDDVLKIKVSRSESNAINSSAISCSVAKWVRCCFPSKKENTIFWPFRVQRLPFKG